MTQSKKMSVIETWTQMIAGYLISVGLQILIFPIFEINISIGTNFVIGLIFFVTSFLRSITIRRIFNALESKHG
jgi:hypothetical protein